MPKLIGASNPSDCDASAPQKEPQEPARLAAERLSLAARWRHALQEPGGAAEFWEADEAARIWARAEHDEALLSMLREDEDAAENAIGPPAAEFGRAELAHARERFQQRMRAAQDSTAPLPAPQVLEAGDAGALTVSEVVEAMERESQRASPEGARGTRDADWRRALEPVRSSHEALPAHITSRAIGAFWGRLGVAVPRDVSLAFVQTARLLLMGRAATGERLSLARSARPAGISEEVERLVTQAPADAQSPAPVEASEPALPEKEASKQSPDEGTST